MFQLTTFNIQHLDCYLAIFINERYCIGVCTYSKKSGSKYSNYKSK